MRQGGGLIVGAPCPETRVRLLKPGSRTEVFPVPDEAALDAMRAPAGAEGEIIVAGPQVLRGYLGGVGDLETKIRVGDTVWHRTGDCGRFDEKGRIVLLGRCAAVVRLPSGENLHPFLIEAAAMEIPGVRRAAFLLHDGVRLLVIEPAGPVPASDAFAGLKTKGVEAVTFLKKIPMDRRHNAKVEYPALRRLLHASPGIRFL
jgi:acyl-CoA synthetase (AMP-forming)/AMP-acid ligase II